MNLEELQHLKRALLSIRVTPKEPAQEDLAEMAGRILHELYSELVDLAEAMLMLEEMKGVSLETYEDGHIFIDADMIGLRKMNFNFNVPELPNTKRATLVEAIRAVHEEWKK